MLKTDESVIGENFIHKACGVAVIFAVLFVSGLHWRDIGFVRDGRLKNIGLGLILGFGFYTIAYAVECIVLYVQGASPSLKIASGGFSLVKSTEFVSTGIAFILLFNVLNVWMEEGLFRGLFTRLLRERYDCRMTIFITALLFGLWHLIMPVRSFIEGQMKLAPMLLLSAGYVALTFVYGLKMSFLYRMTGSVWAGLSEHFFNNSVINIVHVASSRGSDHLQVVRIVTAQLLSFIFVTILYLLKRKNLLPVF
ncbi:CPBP family intramembrane glutamic endopeptidase [Treponema socranskii]|uniref:CPBP family intramembrane glutamic endopeptidase n=1 Tax=Treponema socranskii TaxID=53419 RepID=UPI0028F0ADA3|nr:CPBP family intramembrane glutamic endopeptidase [Treponema socranskii]